MKWFFKFITSSLGRKLVMGVTGLFLITFLVIHLLLNLSLLAGDGGESFTAGVHFMESNPLIAVMAYVLYAGFIIHIFQGISLWMQNKKARNVKYNVKKYYKTTWASRNMAFMGSIILFFLIVHLGDFFIPLKVMHTFGEHDLYAKVIAKFSNPIYLVIYEIGMVALFVHLYHGFQSAFQSLGLTHMKYTPLIKSLGWIYSILVPLGFAAIPLVIFFSK